MPCYSVCREFFNCKQQEFVGSTTILVFHNSWKFTDSYYDGCDTSKQSFDNVSHMNLIYEYYYKRGKNISSFDQNKADILKLILSNDSQDTQYIGFIYTLNKKHVTKFLLITLTSVRSLEIFFLHNRWHFLRRYGDRQP
jgi:hypothetical protein